MNQSYYRGKAANIEHKVAWNLYIMGLWDHPSPHMIIFTNIQSFTIKTKYNISWGFEFQNMYNR